MADLAQPEAVPGSADSKARSIIEMQALETLDPLQNSNEFLNNVYL